MKKKKRWWLWGLGTIVVLAIVILTAASFYLYHFAIEPTPKTLTKGNGRDTLLIQNKKWLQQQHPQTWTETSATDHLKLVADYLPAKKATTKTMILAHGYMNKKEDMANYARMFHNQGYNVLIPDDRGSGHSEGTYIGFGWPDRLDYVKWIKQVIQKNGSHSKIGLFGVSMGGATVMMASGEKLPAQVKLIIEDCGYSSIENELTYELNEQFHMPKQPLITTAAWVTKLRAHYDFRDGSSTKALAKNKLPMLFIHGTKDTFVPTKMVYANYKADKAPGKELWLVKGAKHAASFEHDPAKYAAKVSQFAHQYF
ncbi:cell surface hydrolase [Lactobacillus selangorensis]|uniref:Cell surface hydrolase n=1 Tax=Lactobacillus selangorensis TaxID=81857 RepID=A0A0R2FTQ4_9LACO|nr:alpha/beta hydrolase [Lactobacillus selangorensis]KRN28173.1 cell surface hydrolase [Lactobacillus selangorensis]KRN30951.1 cell surface hydrolase [Lactobacillus selangorensis]